MLITIFLIQKIIQKTSGSGNDNNNSNPILKKVEIEEKKIKFPTNLNQKI